MAQGFQPRANMVSYSLQWVVLSVLVLTVFAKAPAPISKYDDTASRIRAINEDVDRQLQEMMSQQAIVFTTVNTTGLPYNATTKFNPKGMGQLYNVTKMFIDLIQSKQAFPEGMIKNDRVDPKVLQFADPRKEWRSIVTHYGGLVGLAVAGLILAAILPCVGLFFCCCRCAGHCGARSQPFDKKHDHCRKVFLSILLIGVATILLFGVVCAFVTNEHMQEGTMAFPSNVKISLKDAELYLTTTKKEISTVLIKNYEELEARLNNILQASGRIVTDELEVYSRAVSLKNLNDIVTGLDAIKQDLEKIQNITRDLREDAVQLDIAVRGVKRDLLPTLAKCKAPECAKVINDYKVNEMSVQVEFDRLPNVTLALRNVSSIMEGNIVAEVRQGRDAFLGIRREIQKAVNETIPSVSDSVRNAGLSLFDVSNNVTAKIEEINKKINREFIPNLKYVQDAIDQYSMYRYYLGLGVSGVLLTVLMCLTSGLFCGICGKRPDGYGDDCCNKGSGARFLMLAVWVIFLLMSVLMVITSVHMIVGVIAQRAVCEPLKNPVGNRMFEVADKMLEIKKRLYPTTPETNINMAWILTKCHANETLYEVLQLKHMIDVESLRSYVDRFSISSTVDQLREKIRLSPGIVLLSDSAVSKLNDLANSGLSDINFYRYAELLKNNITNINLEHLGHKLRRIAAQVPSDQIDVHDNLISNAFNLELYHRDLVVPMSALSEQLSISALALEEHIKFNYSSMHEAIHSLVKEVAAAQGFLQKDGPEYVQRLAVNFGAEFIRQLEDFLDHLIITSRQKIGKCGPLSNAYNATIVAGCNRILDPFNGFWTSVGWSLIMFIPTIILCVKLSALYQKSDPYPGPLVESEYLYDAYADRDNMPLAHVHDKKHSHHSRHHPNAYVESYDGPVGAAGTYSGRHRTSDSHQGSSHNDSRYSDHAPNTAVSWHRHDRVASSKPETQNKVYNITLDSQNWDFPNGGPPRYQPPPGAPPLSTEYERPPPYYYPGPVDRN